MINNIKLVSLLNIFTLIFIVQLSNVSAEGFDTLSSREWNDTAVRKVVHAFSYGGFSSDSQIEQWADMYPQDAIDEILTLHSINEKLSPSEDDSSLYGSSLKELQVFWGGDEFNNPVLTNNRRFFPQLNTMIDGVTTGLSISNLEKTWIQAVNTRGINPFRHKLGLYMTNYHMAIHSNKTRAALMQDFYDAALRSLEDSSNGIGNFFDVLAEGATSAAVAKAYGHQYNRYRNTGSRVGFYGNDDFAREFHQLFFKVLGTSETGTSDFPGQEYHENVTIEHTAWALTGMRLDRMENAFNSTDSNDWLIHPLDFTDHADLDGRTYIDSHGIEKPILLNNYTNHHWDCLEIYNSAGSYPNVCGLDAKEKLYKLAQITGYHEESLKNLPIAVINFFADDNLSDEKKIIIHDAWLNQEPKDLLAFLKNYAISHEFHDENTVKYRSAFNRNLIIQNKNVLTNEESFVRYKQPREQMIIEGARVFHPAHDVFGGQTGLQAANNPNIFKAAYTRNVENTDFLAAVEQSYTDSMGIPQTWVKDWANVIPINNKRKYIANEVAKWLWNHFLADDHINYDKLAEVQLTAILATGYDFGYIADPLNPDISYAFSEINNDRYLNNIFRENKKALVAIDSEIPEERLEANRRIGMAINFITVTPFMFAQEGK